MKLSSVLIGLTVLVKSVCTAEKSTLTRNKAFVPRSVALPRGGGGPLDSTTTVPRSAALSIPRGGAGPLDSSTVAKTSSTILLAAHVLSVLGTEKAMKAYGVKQPTPEHVFICRKEWTFFVATSLIAYLIFVHDKSINTAVGYGTFPVIAEVLRSILNDEEEKLGIPNVAQVLVVLAPQVVTAYACLQNLESANTVMLICGAYNVLKGIWYFLDTENAGKKWGLEVGADKYILGSAKWLGVSLFVYGMLLLSFSQDVDKTKLLGYAWIPVVLNMAREVYLVKTSEEDTDANLPLFYIWMIFGAVVIGTLAID